MTSRFGRLSTVLLLSLVVLAAFVGGSAASGAEPPEDGSRYGAEKLTPTADPVELPAELQTIQRSLGGPSVNQFPSLRGDGVPIQSRLRAGLQERAANPARPDRDAIRALRDAAAQLDASANRLESLELYAQADAMRQLAQRMRIDARTTSGALDSESSNYRPDAWTEPWPRGGTTQMAPSPHWGDVMPRLQTTPQPEFRIRPRSSEAPAPSDQPPALEPMPQPENRDNRPKPQPLMDSPQVEPKPDVKVEG